MTEAGYDSLPGAAEDAQTSMRNFFSLVDSKVQEEEASEDCSELVAYLDFCNKIKEALKTRHGLDVSVEYPGCVVIRDANLEYWFGAVNELWGASLAMIIPGADGVSSSEPIDDAYVETAVSSDCRDVETVIEAIRATFLSDVKTRRSS